MNGQHNTLAGTAGSHTSRLIGGYRVSNNTGYFLYSYFVTGEDNKAIFSVPIDTPRNFEKALLEKI